MQEKEIQSIGQAIEAKKTAILQKKKGGVNSQRSYTVEQLMTFMGENPMNSARFRYWLGRTRKLEPSQIYEFMSKAKGSKNPPALFNWQLKKHNEKIQMGKSV